MAVDVRERSLDDELLAELERAWDAPAVRERSQSRRRAARWRPATEREAHRRAVALAVTWAVVYAVFIAAEQRSGPASVATFDWWGFLGGLLFWIAALGGAAALWLRQPHAALGCSALLGAASTMLAIGCRGTTHHPTHFWIVELAASAALTAVSVRALASRR